MYREYSIRQPWKNGMFLLMACCIALCFPAGEAMSNSQKPSEVTFIISVEPGSLGTGLPSEERLVGIGRELALSLFPDDVGKSLRVRGRISLTDRGKDHYRFDLSLLFLYRESYTAVDHQVVFDVSGEKVTVVSSK
jgi:hypothetical protein